MMETVGVTTADYATEGAAQLRAILAGRRDGVRYIEDHPDEAADITAKAFNSIPARNSSSGTTSSPACCRIGRAATPSSPITSSTSLMPGWVFVSRPTSAQPLQVD